MRPYAFFVLTTTGQLVQLLFGAPFGRLADPLEIAALDGEDQRLHGSRLRDATARVDQNLSGNDHLMYRASYWTFDNPFFLRGGTTTHPSAANLQNLTSENAVVTWSRVLSSTKVQELKVGFNGFHHPPGIVEKSMAKAGLTDIRRHQVVAPGHTADEPGAGYWAAIIQNPPFALYTATKP